MPCRPICFLAILTVQNKSLALAPLQDTAFRHFLLSFLIFATLSAFEALLRWNSPEHGLVSPVRFIPLAEQSQLIVPIGEWILSQACQFLHTLADLGHSRIRVAVNVSHKQLAHKGFVDSVRQILDAAKIMPRQLELEITESALSSSLEESRFQLQKLKELGVRLALDDFGTGYSSMTHLHLFPVTTLKVDKSFVDNIPGQDSVFVHSLIHFAQNLDMSVVAEGVECQEQKEYLQACGCDFIQGYFFSHPLPIEKALDFLQTHNPGAKGGMDSNV